MAVELAGHTQPAILCTSDGTAVGASNPLPVGGTDLDAISTALQALAGGTATPPGGALTDKSGTITSGGSAQQAAAANAARRYLLVSNPSAAEDLWFNLGTAAVANQPSIRLPPGTAWESPSSFCPTGLVSVIAATTSHAFTVKEA